MSTALIVTTIAVVVGASAQATTGIGFGLVSSPFLVALLGKEGLRTSIFMGTLTCIAALLVHHREVKLPSAVRLFVPAAVVSTGVAWIVRGADTERVAAVAGALTILGVAAMARGLRSRRLEGDLGAVVAGALCGGMTAVGGVGGPPAALYSLNAGWPARSRVATLQALFLALNLVTLASLGLPRPRPVLLVALAVGWTAGANVGRRLPEHGARTATLAVAALGGAFALIRGIS
ncbi:MAG TPA: TSUP family transporter [Acidimicrobiales bacterium]|nr:TSUP family transporter [Acidimicrobiales bacterium]